MSYLERQRLEAMLQEKVECASHRLRQMRSNDPKLSSAMEDLQLALSTFQRLLEVQHFTSAEIDPSPGRL